MLTLIGNDIQRLGVEAVDGSHEAKDSGLKGDGGAWTSSFIEVLQNNKYSYNGIESYFNSANSEEYQNYIGCSAVIEDGDNANIFYIW